ncbi:MAG: glycosyltransferase family 87 protein [Nostoc sp.]
MLVIITAVCILLAFSLGVNKKGVGGFYDFSYFYIAGKCWLNHQSPYNLYTYTNTFNSVKEVSSIYRHDPFAYPPQIAAFCVLLALLDFSSARIIVIALNLIAAGLLAILAVKLVTDAEKPRPASSMSTTKWLLPSLILAYHSTGILVWMGQITLMIGASMVGAWYFTINRKKFLLGGLLLGLSTMKPQYLILPVLWLFLERQWKTLIVASIVSFALAVFGLLMLSNSPIYSIQEWLQAFSEYQTRRNAMGGDQVMGLPSALTDVGLNIPGLSVLIIGIAVITIVLWFNRSKFGADDIFGILLSMQFSLTYSKFLEIPLLVPLLSGLWLHIAHRKKLWVIAIVGLIILCFPRSGYNLTPHSRTFVIFFALLALLFLSYHQVAMEHKNRAN